MDPNSNPSRFNRFKPMPKRFMVWDKRNKAFRTNNNDDARVFDLAAVIGFYLYESGCGIPHTDFDLVQSTNLFDRDGREIFEGSILLEQDDSISVVHYDGDEGMFRTKCGNVLDDMSCGGDYFEVIGHILSNQELLEEKC